ncbi:hypothetical protein GQ472_01820 [archaeon]|nr:hypothetical protein [archaeon]
MEIKGKLITIAIVSVLCITLSLFYIINDNNMVSRHQDPDNDTVALASDLTPDLADAIEGMMDMPEPEPEPEPEPDTDEYIVLSNPIDPDLSDGEVCILYLHNKTNSCGSFSGGGSSYSLSSSSSNGEPEEDVAIPEFSSAMIPILVCMMGLYMRRLQDI